jgi:hypothetical protein
MWVAEARDHAEKHNAELIHLAVRPPTACCLLDVQGSQSELAQRQRLGKVYERSYIGVESASGTRLRVSSVGQRGTGQTVSDRHVETSHHMHGGKFQGCRCFSRANQELASLGQTAINWNL